MKLRKKILASTISVLLISGCSLTPSEHHSGVTKNKENLFSYSDAHLEQNQALIERNKGRSEATLLRRQLEELRGRLTKLTELESELSRKIQQAQYETEAEEPKSNEQNRIALFQEATKHGQQRMAANTVHHEQATAEIDAELESKMAQLEVDADLLMSNIKNNLRLRKARLKAQAITQKAAVSSSLAQGNANIVAPVLTTDNVYAYDEPVKEVPTPVEKPAVAKISSSDLKLAAKEIAIKQSEDTSIAPVVASAVSIKQGFKPVVSQKKSRTVHDVVYVYEDRDSWRRFESLLKAHGVKDVWAVHSKSKGYFIYVGRYNKASDAIRRKAYLAKVIHSDHAKLKSTKIYL